MSEWSFCSDNRPPARKSRPSRYRRLGAAGLALPAVISEGKRALGRRLLGVAWPLLGAIGLASATGAAAQTYTVSNLTDSGVENDGSLRGEVKAANANPGADTVVFAPGLTGTITFGGGGIVINGPLDLEGPGPGPA